MGNRVKKDSVFVIAETLVDNSAQKAGEVIGYYKDDRGRWISVDRNGKKWQNLISNLRNENYYKIHKQYPLQDLVYYLQELNENCLTVMWEKLVDAVNTAFKETRINSAYELYLYVVGNLL